MRIRALIGLALPSLSILLAAPGASSGPAPVGKTIKGQVLDSADGRPLSGVWVMAWDERKNPRWDQDGMRGALIRGTVAHTQTWDEVFSDSTGFYQVRLGLGGGLLVWKTGYEPLVLNGDSLQVSLPCEDCCAPVDVEPLLLQRALPLSAEQLDQEVRVPE